MTPKEKAKELVETFENYASGLNNDVFDDYECLKNAKQCALIAVDEILENFGFHENKHYTNYGAIEFYEEVKTEIEKL
jgi:hypothetical protein